jgi:hypothetical protein
MQVDYLSDPDQSFAALVNCKVEESEIKCGFAWFLGGISGDIELVSPEGFSVLILIPKEVQNVATAHVLCNPDEAIAIQRIKL